MYFVFLYRALKVIPSPVHLKQPIAWSKDVGSSPMKNHDFREVFNTNGDSTFDI
jgi:hypothetical protein